MFGGNFGLNRPLKPDYNRTIIRSQSSRFFILLYFILFILTIWTNVTIYFTCFTPRGHCFPMVHWASLVPHLLSSQTCSCTWHHHLFIWCHCMNSWHHQNNTNQGCLCLLPHLWAAGGAACVITGWLLTLSAVWLAGWEERGRDNNMLRKQNKVVKRPWDFQNKIKQTMKFEPETETRLQPRGQSGRASTTTHSRERERVINWYTFLLW